VDGLTEDTKTVFRMPTSPRGWVLSKPPHHNQSGGQLRPFQYVNSGWFRSNMDGTPFGSGSQSLQTRNVKSGQIYIRARHQFVPAGSTSNHRCCATPMDRRIQILGWQLSRDGRVRRCLRSERCMGPRHQRQARQTRPIPRPDRQATIVFS